VLAVVLEVHEDAALDGRRVDAGLATFLAGGLVREAADDGPRDHADALGLVDVGEVVVEDVP